MISTVADINIITTYPVMESFYTIQGEGAFTGHAAYFIRLGGCDVGCVWCDVKDSWNADNHPKITAGDIIKSVKRESGARPGAGKPIIVITGGEPLMHNLDALTSLLKEEGYTINIETSGSSPLSGHLDWICLSPKKFKAPLDEVVKAANELKVVVFNQSDFAWAERYAALVPSNCKLFLQPEWDKRDQMTPLIVDYIKENPQWQLSLQTHKYINVP
jgi:organic radical activating enzyme